MVKLYARTESDVNLPVCAFVSPLQVCLALAHSCCPGRPPSFSCNRPWSVFAHGGE